MISVKIFSSLMIQSHIWIVTQAMLYTFRQQCVFYEFEEPYFKSTSIPGLQDVIESPHLKTHSC